MWWEWVNNKLAKLIRKKEFWVGVVAVLIISIIFDLLFLSFWSIKEIFFTKRDPLLSGLVLANILVDVIQKRGTTDNQKFKKSLSKVLFLFVVIFSLLDYGFFKTFYLVIGMMILIRFMKFILKRFNISI